MFHANRTPILHQDKHYLQTDRTELSLEPLHLGVPSGTSTTVSELFGALDTNHAPILHRNLYYLQLD